MLKNVNETSVQGLLKVWSHSNIGMCLCLRMKANCLAECNTDICNALQCSRGSFEKSDNILPENMRFGCIKFGLLFVKECMLDFSPFMRGGGGGALPYEKDERVHIF